ncbi:serine/threonine-protein kinase [Cellulomonas shaoxiangyii]|uniref:serine/threonine-protein kinase n=1 Tax=Cellulomonas shaoxiangyii TaxID=2566013 RepID=UPI001AA01397|nr:serine/threonine-protein kinase [Cellulomonas shaoxiangyii]
MERIGLTPGSEIGGYTIVAPLGSGGMGTVYRAVDGGGTAVALKLLHPHVGADAVVRTRLMREVAALQRLRHPAVAAVLDAEADSTEAFIVTELVPGDTLTEHVRERGPLAPEDLLALAEGLRSALAAVHAAGVVHRDLKPSNVLLTDDGPVLIDFGLAQGVDDDATLTTAGFVLGTPGYLAPELLDGAEPSVATDLWGWAALLAFAATGRDPFGSRPVEAVLALARSGDADLAGVGPLTAAAIAGALRPDPAERTTPEDVVAALRVVAAEGELPPGADAAVVLAAVTGAAGADADADDEDTDVAVPEEGEPGDELDDEPDDELDDQLDDELDDDDAALAEDDVATTLVGRDEMPTTVVAADVDATRDDAPAGASDDDASDDSADDDDPDDDLDDAADHADEDGAAHRSAGAGTAPTVALAGAAARAGTTAVGPPEPPANDGYTVAVPLGAGRDHPDRDPDATLVDARAWEDPAGHAAHDDGFPDDGFHDDGFPDDDPDDPDGVDWIEDDLERSEGPSTEGSGYVRPRARRRWGTLLALALLVGVAGAHAPGITLAVVLVLVVVVRAVGSTVESMHGRRERAGVRRSDVPLAVASSPWYLVRALVGLLPSVLVSASVVVIAVGVAWWLVGSGRWVLGDAVPGEPPSGLAASVAVGSAVLLAVLVLWFGPLSAMTRTGARRVLAGVAPGWVGALVVVALALVAAAALAHQVLAGSPIEWAPLPVPRMPLP